MGSSPDQRESPGHTRVFTGRVHKHPQVTDKVFTVAVKGRGTVIGCYLYNKPSREVSSLLNIHYHNKVEATGNDSNSDTKWSATLNDGARSVDADAQSAQRSPTLCKVNRYRPPNFMWPSDQVQNSAESFMECVSMAEQLHPSQTSAQYTASDAVTYSTLPLDSRAVEMFSGATNRSSPSDLMDESGSGVCQENGT